MNCRLVTAFIISSMVALVAASPIPAVADVVADVAAREPEIEVPAARGCGQNCW
ncbi:hypothetical protein P691DRAFT_775314 [Macrolepiota fuliginosa MF-IS2]|uniref:Uncharacterized protein n=1 Tax=Macrolepiota fuliginosa MF-IS2 TaxID=1400762 RepID=A0A9P6C273_9AGAR|nr:hypothetical protein P691DRAFT_775314 [Macrolepiota fuliginosa MF-IS2]